MPLLMTLQDLTRLREGILERLRLERETGTAIFVGMGTCGMAAGARETLDAIREELEKQQIEATVGTVGCIGMCAREPLVDIQQAGKAHILYGNIKPEMVPRLIAEHLLKGQPVKEWVVCRMVR